MRSRRPRDLKEVALCARPNAHVQLLPKTNDYGCAICCGKDAERSNIAKRPGANFATELAALARTHHLESTDITQHDRDLVVLLDAIQRTDFARATDCRNDSQLAQRTKLSRSRDRGPPIRSGPFERRLKVGPKVLQADSRAANRLAAIVDDTHANPVLARDLRLRSGVCGRVLEAIRANALLTLLRVRIESRRRNIIRNRSERVRRR
jgi:hypothetical protein